MTAIEFRQLAEKHGPTIAAIRKSAHELHQSVGQKYDKVHPYGFHLDMVADGVREFGHAVCVNEDDIVPLFFGAFYHDSMEDARLTYNDVKGIALQWMNPDQALMAAEMVYALTNEKGRTRAERANDKYYRGIRETPYAPFLKLSDRLANAGYSCSQAGSGAGNSRMKQVYSSEWPHFLSAITSASEDVRYSLPPEMVERLRSFLE